MSHKNENERGWVGQLTVKLDVTDCTGIVNTGDCHVVTDD